MTASQVAYKRGTDPSRQMKSHLTHNPTTDLPSGAFFELKYNNHSIFEYLYANILINLNKYAKYSLVGVLK